MIRFVAQALVVLVAGVLLATWGWDRWAPTGGLPGFLLVVCWAWRVQLRALREP